MPLDEFSLSIAGETVEMMESLNRRQLTTLNFLLLGKRNNQPSASSSKIFKGENEVEPRSIEIHSRVVRTVRQRLTTQSGDDLNRCIPQEQSDVSQLSSVSFFVKNLNVR